MSAFTLDKLAQIGFNTCLGKSAGLLLQNTRIKNFTVSSLTEGFLLAMDAITSSWMAAIFVWMFKKNILYNVRKNVNGENEQRNEDEELKWTGCLLLLKS